ncbi:prominin family protein [Fulvivirga sedimenti]|uniref:Prominin family protein n=1 Tax=Fulvivirga sedimenti TaxID=2879465 RepID=A0A9X1KWU1_9BACT|nr:prominin family protein [Fulvivirga sedimenti]MCA6075095.1 prominin family protein [Fulvivirga sedimenti]MCA6076272.1 prominin family protein [Fulvivirga sedimenti]MCA6077400.1 prominin family protein [Fulvivirga sedimenti]
MSAQQKQDRSTWVIGGTTLMGLGVGFIFLTISPFIMVASLLIGIGLGLVIVPFLSHYSETH